MFKPRIYLVVGLTFFLSAFGSSSPASATSQTTTVFSFTGAVQTWTVPNGVTSITFDVRGAQGKNTVYVGNESAGGRVQGSLSVTSGTVLSIYVGGKATSNQGGYNGGGTAGSSGGGGGGGASDIRNGATKLVVAGGAGGTGNNCGCTSDMGGIGGGITGGAAAIGGTGAGGGTSSAGGAAGTYVSKSGTSGSLGQGGDGAADTNGGGGGGGYYGGGGASWWGGGGGSSYADAVLTSNVTHTQGFQTGNGYVSITYGDVPLVFNSFSIAGNPKSVSYRSSTTISANVSVSSRITFYANKVRIPGCVSKITSGTSPNFTATCTWIAARKGAVRIEATANPITAGYSSGSSATLNTAVNARTTLR